MYNDMEHSLPITCPYHWGGACRHHQLDIMKIDVERNSEEPWDTGDPPNRQKLGEVVSQRSMVAKRRNAHVFKINTRKKRLKACTSRIIKVRWRMKLPPRLAPQARDKGAAIDC